MWAQFIWRFQQWENWAYIEKRKVGTWRLADFFNMFITQLKEGKQNKNQK